MRTGVSLFTYKGKNCWFGNALWQGHDLTWSHSCVKKAWIHACGNAPLNVQELTASHACLNGKYYIIHWGNEGFFVRCVPGRKKRSGSMTRPSDSFSVHIEQKIALSKNSDVVFFKSNQMLWTPQKKMSISFTVSGWCRCFQWWRSWSCQIKHKHWMDGCG